MIKELSIKNFTLIDKLKINFNNGMNVIMGETGSGKSNIIDALSILMGNRASKEKIRYGFDKSIISCAIDISERHDLIKYLEEINLFNPDEYLVISRIIQKNSSTISRVNDQIVTAQILKNIASYLIDIYGQFENQLILSKNKQLDFLDRLICGQEENKEIYRKFNQEYEKYKTLKDKIENFKKSPEEVNRNTEFLEFQIQDIENSNVLNIDEESIYKKLEKIENTQDLQENSGQVLTYLDNSPGGATYNISKSLELTNQITRIDESLLEINERLESSLIELEDIRREVQYYSDSIYFDESEYQKLNSQRNMIFEMKRKYGQTIEEIKNFYEKSIENLDEIKNYERNFLKLKDDLNKAYKKAFDLANVLSDLRKEFSSKFQDRLMEELVELEMNNSRFKIDFKKIEMGSNGIDSINFLVSFNKNEELKDFSLIASGGEISRFMLAIKSIEAGIDKTPILIFDEIDTGISGNASNIVGNKLKKISEGRTLICISHLPQIIAKADYQYLVYKREVNGKTTSSARLLNYRERIVELAKIIEGDGFSNLTLDTAEKMIINNLGVENGL